MSIYQHFCREVVDESGALCKIELDYPENFNFGYDVVDAIASTRTGAADKPVEPQIMKSVTVETFGEKYPAPKKLEDPYARFR